MWVCCNASGAATVTPWESPTARVRYAPPPTICVRLHLFFFSGPCVTINSQPGANTNDFFHVQYSAYSQAISGTCLVQAGGQSGHGDFVAFVSPPTVYTPDAIVGRDLVSRCCPRMMLSLCHVVVSVMFAQVFLLDRSGSMHGVPMQEAKKALSVALQRLTVQDRFAICAFDDREEWFGMTGTGIYS